MDIHDKQPEARSDEFQDLRKDPELAKLSDEELRKMLQDLQKLADLMLGWWFEQEAGKNL